MNGFQRHNIHRLSPSSINTWAACPSAWVANYLLGKRPPVGAAAHRGTATEYGVERVLFDGMDPDAAAQAAVEQFDRLARGVGPLPTDPDYHKERDAIPAFLAQALELFPGDGVRPSRPDDGRQHMVETHCRFAEGEHGRIRVIGYLDFWYEDQGTIYDLKTTHRIPSRMSIEHRRQNAIYAHAAGNHFVEFLYASTKKGARHHVEDVPGALAEVRAQVRQLESFLRLSDSPQVLAASVPLQPESFYWRGPRAQAIHQDIFGVAA